MLDMIQTAKSLKIAKEELNAMMDILYEGINNERYFESKEFKQIV